MFLPMTNLKGVKSRFSFSSKCRPLMSLLIFDIYIHLTFLLRQTHTCVRVRDIYLASFITTDKKQVLLKRTVHLFYQKRYVYFLRDSCKEEVFCI